MHLLPKTDYHKAQEPLRRVSSNNLFAQCVIERRVNGSVFVDDVDHPSTFYIVHPYGMSLLLGNTENHRFNAAFLDYALNCHNKRATSQWMQVFPSQWEAKLMELFGDNLKRVSDNLSSNSTSKVELHTRVNFKFNSEKYMRFKHEAIKQEYNIKRVGINDFNGISGTVVPKYFWDSAADFYEHGVGFSVYIDNCLASTAYSAYVIDNFLEMGIETVERFRNKGMAKYACSALIDYCIEHGYEPVWACRFENTGSYLLAQKLGFEPTNMYPYYKLE
jgi:GNAT superfamily N-acetyltransferase